MRTKVFISTILLLILNTSLYCQEYETKNLQGSWMGRVTSQNWSLRIIFRFKEVNGNIRGYIDSPDQAMKDIPLDKVWIINDSVFTDATNSMRAGIIFKGLILPGDSVIDGIWGGKMAVRLSRTQYKFELKTNLNPEIEGYKITKLIKSTPIKDQQITGTCWSYATTSFIETEAIRLGKAPVILSPMFYITPMYTDKAEKYIRMDGNMNFSEGDLTFTVLNEYKEHGAIPESIYSGTTDSYLEHDHTEMNREVLEKVKSYVKTGRGKMTMDGIRKDIQNILSITMGKAPEKFSWLQKEYSPKSFASEMIGINPDDYVEITSYNHHEFYKKCILEIPSNWNNNYYLNIPINDFIAIVDSALLNNYSVCWDGDIYEGYNNGFAVLNDTGNYCITQQMRQTAFDNKTTTDVHNMHIIGIAENDKGMIFYILKNSSDARNCGGYLYMSKEYLLLKTISVLVNKEALPEGIKHKVSGIL